MENKRFNELLDFDNLYFEEDLNGSNVARKEDGTFDVSVVINDRHVVKNFKSLGLYMEYISMIARLKCFNYPVREMEFYAQNRKLEYIILTSPGDVLKNYTVLKKAAEELKSRYGENYEEHIDELMYSRENKDAVSELENYDEIQSVYDRLKLNFEVYKEGLPEEDRKDFDVAMTIYSSSLFVAMNRIAAVEDYQNKSGADLIAECDQNEDFKDSFHERFKHCRDVLSLQNDNEEKRVLNNFSRLIDFSSEESFAESLKKVLEIIDKHKDKLVVPEDIIVYRGVASKNVIDKDSLAESSIISTSLNKNVADGFASRSGPNGKYKYVNCMLVEKGTPYIMPINEQADQQKEIVLIDSAIKTERVGGIYRDSDVVADMRAFKISPNEKVKEKNLREVFVEESKESGSYEAISKVPQVIREVVNSRDNDFNKDDIKDNIEDGDNR